jgi:hypothetical protein
VFSKSNYQSIPHHNLLHTKKTKLHGLSRRANYTDRANAACRRSDCQLLRIEGATWSAWRIPTAVYTWQYSLHLYLGIQFCLFLSDFPIIVLTFHIFEFWRFPIFQLQLPSSELMALGVSSDKLSPQTFLVLTAEGLTTIFLCVTTVGVLKLTVCLWEVINHVKLLLALASTINCSSGSLWRLYELCK